MKNKDEFAELITALKTPDERRPSAKQLQYSTITTSASEARRKAAHALGERRDPRAVEPLIEALDDWSEEVQVAAAWALTNIGHPRAFEAIEKALSREIGHNSSMAMRRHLLNLGDPRSIPLLMRALKDEWLAGSAVDGLVTLMTHAPDKISTRDIEYILSLVKVVQIEGAWDYRELNGAEYVEVDLSNLKHLAREELDRRGKA